MSNAITRKRFTPFHAPSFRKSVEASAWLARRGMEGSGLKGVPVNVDGAGLLQQRENRSSAGE